MEGWYPQNTYHLMLRVASQTDRAAVLKSIPATISATRLPHGPRMVKSLVDEIENGRLHPSSITKRTAVYMRS